jgi:pentapeptide MXKDX repeat protein
MKWNMSTAVILAASLSSAAVGAQSGGAMAKNDRMDNMKKMDASYSGCLESGAGAGTFVLTHLAVDGMAKDTMKGNAMKEDTMKGNAMKEDTMAQDSMSHGSMTPAALALTGSSAALRKHLGHKVTVVGSLEHEKMEKMDAMDKDTMGKDTMGKDAMGKATPAFTVKSVKMIAATCS